jgi:hypothetical protein
MNAQFLFNTFVLANTAFFRTFVKMYLKLNHFLRPFYLIFMRLIILFISFFICVHSISAQKDRNSIWEAGMMFGATGYSGDVSEKTITLNQVQPGYGFFLRHYFNKNFALKAHVYSGSISGDDKGTSRAARSYRFGSSIFEGALVGEYVFFGKDRISKTGIFRPRLNPYVFGGVGFTKSDAKAEYYGPDNMKNFYLKVPLPEEGLKSRFLLVPVGAGVRAELLEWLVIGVEGGVRPVFSDDLDGMKINGDPGDNDWYYFGGITVSVLIGG